MTKHNFVQACVALAVAVAFAPAVNAAPEKVDTKTCGSCHPAQFNSMYKINEERIPRFSKKNSASVAPNPFFDRALGAHGFTKEHDLPRSHAFAALDQYLCDRAFGGRFEPKEGWMYLGQGDGAFRVWDVINDKYPEDNA